MLNSNAWFVIQTMIRCRSLRCPLMYLSRIIHHCRGASLAIRSHSAFALLANTVGIRSLAEITVVTITCAIHSLSGELCRLGSIDHGYVTEIE
jgi:hypothetical protein